MEKKTSSQKEIQIKTRSCLLALPKCGRQNNAPIPQRCPPSNTQNL